MTPHLGVSIHAPVWVRRAEIRFFRVRLPVSIHAPVWVRRAEIIITDRGERFQFTHPCGCDRRYPAGGHPARGFNSRTRVGATFIPSHPTRPPICFNSRTRVGATLTPGDNIPYHIVSIHAPVWVRLMDGSMNLGCIVVSIHAPVWVRQGLIGALPCPVRFQFTHPCGCDAETIHKFMCGKSFNSRTRVGATKTDPLCALELKVSIHAPVWVRPLWLQAKNTKSRFQFTHPCGCDCCRCFFSAGKIGFNSRTRVGATSDCGSYRDFCDVSIHAPVWVRHPFNINPYRNSRFQFTHPCGCDQSRGNSHQGQTVSIHAPVWVRPLSPTPYALPLRFQFTHPCGCDPHIAL